MTAILVTGATGFLGGALTAALLQRGETVIASGRNREKLAALQTLGATIMPGDLSDPRTFSDFKPAMPIKAVIHAAALSSPWGRRDDFIAANITATRNLIQAARNRGVERFVFISSSSVYFAYQDQLDLAEDAALPKPANIYAASKRAAEIIVLAAHDLRPVVLRPRAIYGKGDSALLPRLLKAAQSGPLPLLRNGAAVTDLTHIDDAVSATCAALDGGTTSDGQIINVTSGAPQPVKKVIEDACRCAGMVPPRWRALPLAPLMAAVRLLEAGHALWPGRPEPRVTSYGLGLIAYTQTLNIAKAARLLDWHPQVSFEDGLRRTFGP